MDGGLVGGRCWEIICAPGGGGWGAASGLHIKYNIKRGLNHNTDEGKKGFRNGDGDRAAVQKYKKSPRKKHYQGGALGRSNTSNTPQNGFPGPTVKAGTGKLGPRRERGKRGKNSSNVAAIVQGFVQNGEC